MGRLKEIGGQTAYKAYKTWEEGDYVEGEYLGIIGRDKFNKPKYGVRVTDYQFEDGHKIKVGERFSINSCGGLDIKMEDIDEGMQVRWEYAGQAEIQKGKWAGSMAHNVKVFVLDDEDSEEEEAQGSGRFL